MNVNAPTESQGMDRKAVLGWCLYDWANSAFPTVITTFVFAAYFTGYVAEDTETGTAVWGNAMALAGLIVAVLAPFLGSIADLGGRRKIWLAVFTLICMAGSASLFQVTPDPSMVTLALVGVVVATIGFEFGMVFYNAMLPQVAPASHIGRVSGWGWGVGYMGGLLALMLCLVGFIQTETPWFGVGELEAGGARATTLLVALWFGFFSLPLFFFVKEKPGSGLPMGQAVTQGVANLIGTFRHFKTHKTIFWFLLARMIYADGLTTLFAFGGIYAAGTFGMELSEVILFGITLNVTAGLGALIFSWLDDKRGSKWVIMVSLICMTVIATGTLLVSSKEVFWMLGMALGIFIGPTQAASRSLMARIVPEDLTTEFFGLYAFSGKATTFLGPMILAWATLTFDSQRAGMATILVFFAVGLLLLLPLKLPDLRRGTTNGPAV